MLQLTMVKELKLFYSHITMKNLNATRIARRTFLKVYNATCVSNVSVDSRGAHALPPGQPLQKK